MADVRGATGVPAVSAFGGIRTPTPSTPLYVELATGDLYVLINNTVTLVGAIPGGSGFVIAGQVFSEHSTPLPNLVDVNAILGYRAFTAPTFEPQAIFGDANDILAARVFKPAQFPATWS